MGASPLQSNLSTMELGTELSFVIIAIQVFITYLEFYILAALAIVFLPFGANIHTRFLADKVIPAIMGAGAKLMVMALGLTEGTLPFCHEMESLTDVLKGFGNLFRILYYCGTCCDSSALLGEFLYPLFSGQSISYHHGDWC
jgi:hypothetical protein